MPNAEGQGRRPRERSGPASRSWSGRASSSRQARGRRSGGLPV